MAEQRQQVLEQVRQLLRDLRGLLPAEGAAYNAQLISVHAIIDLLDREFPLLQVEGEEIRLQPLLQAVLFTDVVRVDEGVHILTEWEGVFSEAMDEILQMAHIRLVTVTQLQFEVYTKIQKLGIELFNVLNKCILQLGQISLPPTPVIPPFNID